MWEGLAEKVLAGQSLQKEEALLILHSPDTELEHILKQAYRIRRTFYGNRVRIHVLLNAKSGLCPEDCAFCSQSSVATSPIKRYPILSKDRILSAAKRAEEVGAYRFCIATSTRKPQPKELDTICEAVYTIKQGLRIPVCVSLGMLNEQQIQMLKDAGVDQINHNLETSQNFFPRICSTHTYNDRVDTVKRIKASGLHLCCGGIIGIGESDQDIYDLAVAVGRLGADSIPVNFLDPRPGTPLANHRYLTPQRCLKILAMFRFLNPSKDIRAAGGREVNLKGFQHLLLYPASSLFADGYLTTSGQSFEHTRRMIYESGFQLERPYS
jgi:biotin synthase